MNHPLIIGAGGVASYLLPVLLKTFHPEKVTIVDKDTLEERNLDRQLFDQADIGKNKAAALAYKHGLQAIPEWFTTSTTLPDNIDAIICCADNHEARFAAIQSAELHQVYCYLGGNEYIDSQALVWHADWKGKPHDLLQRYKTIATDKTGSPFRCTGDAQVVHPQLAMANMHCAAKLCHLMWIYERWLPQQKFPTSQDRQNLLPYLPVEFYSTTLTNTSDCLSSLTC